MMSKEQKKMDVKQTVKHRDNYNYNNTSRYIGFRCPNELFNRLLKEKKEQNKITEFLIELLEKYDNNVKQSVKQTVKIATLNSLKFLMDFFQENAKLLQIHNKAFFIENTERFKEINKILEGV